MQKAFKEIRIRELNLFKKGKVRDILEKRSMLVKKAEVSKTQKEVRFVLTMNQFCIFKPNMLVYIEFHVED